jgi:hypothetical protein
MLLSVAHFPLKGRNVYGLVLFLVMSRDARDGSEKALVNTSKLSLRL